LGEREKEVSLRKEDSETSITLAELVRWLGVKLEDSEGSLMILVNGKVTSYASDHELPFQVVDWVGNVIYSLSKEGFSVCGAKQGVRPMNG
jgi:hypothetical protein